MTARGDDSAIKKTSRPNGTLAHIYFTCPPLHGANQIHAGLECTSVRYRTKG